MNFFATREPDPDLETRRAVFRRLVLELERDELLELEQQIRLRLWRGRIRFLRRFPAAIKLGLVYSCLTFLVILLIPLPDEPPIFVPLLIAATGCVAITLVAILDLILGIMLVRLKPQVPAFNLLEASSEPAEPAYSETNSSAQEPDYERL